jgi:PIN domain nuclease of toxin-antitoxin system
VRVLLDTHTVLWFALNDPQLSPAALAAILDPANEKLISPACHWEVAIKVSIRKYSLTVPHEQFFTEALSKTGFSVLPIEPKHTAIVTTLPFHHRDPFDRLLISQALAENIPLISGDATFDAYGIQRLW